LPEAIFIPQVFVFEEHNSISSNSISSRFFPPAKSILDELECLLIWQEAPGLSLGPPTIYKAAEKSATFYISLILLDFSPVVSVSRKHHAAINDSRPP